MSWERYRNDKEIGFQVEVVWTDKTAGFRSIACHSSLTELPPPALPEWEWDPQRYNDIITKIQSLKELAVTPFSDVQRQYNQITAKGRKMVAEREIVWLWGQEVPIEEILSGGRTLTEKDMAISTRILEYQKSEALKRAKGTDGFRVDPPEIESSTEFWTKQQLLAAEGRADEMQREQGIRKIWLKVYEELSELYEIMAAPGPAGDDSRLSRLENGIIQACRELQNNVERVTDEGISTYLANKGITNEKGEPYTREHINRVKNKLKDKGHLKM